jgi:hypothetical protein
LILSLTWERAREAGHAAAAELAAKAVSALATASA